VESGSDQDFVHAWRQRQEALRLTAEAWRHERLAQARVAAQALASFAGVKRVLLFGSLARGQAGPGSDIDLWVEGLQEADWLDAVRVARQVVDTAEVDIVRAEWAGPQVAARATAEGIVLLER